MIEEYLQQFPDSPASHSSSSDIKSLMRSAFESPVNHPAISETIFPGDRIAVLVQKDLPSPRESIESLVCLLEESRIETEDMLIVVPFALKSELGLELIPGSDAQLPTVAAKWRSKTDRRETPLRFEIHDTENEHASCYLGANEQGNPIYVNRSLADCDVVIPLSSPHPGDVQVDCLYPEFSNEEIRQRFRKKEDSSKERLAETTLANNSLGLFFSIEMICRPGGQVDEILCGSRDQTRVEAKEKLNTLWELNSEIECDMVIATMESGPSGTWKSFVLAVLNAATLCPSDGPIVVLSNLNESPGAKLKSACAAQFEGSIPAKLPQKYQRLASILCERPVYLKSNLSANRIEDLGIGFIESPDSLARIARPWSQPLVLRDAHLRNVAFPQRV